MRWLLTPSILVAMLAVGHDARAAEPSFSACLNEFWRQRPPVFAVQGPLYALCASHFATLYSSRTETPLYSAEHLTAQQIEDAVRMPRNNAFHDDGRLPSAVASTLEDYRGSGFDRGHMAPSGDEPDSLSQYESFALSNMVPQNPNDNRYLWADIETAVRELVLAGGDEVYVVTGPLFDLKGAGALQGKVEVPAYIYKAVYDPVAGIAGAYVARNAPGWEFWKLSLTEFRDRSGIDPFPGVPEGIEADASKLPDPIHRRYARP
ncbi:DNA/RNA non-specific endonuclease [Acidisoma cellulosilytica]|uniref:Endonuclease n=1 Tax=Acidisoma cellulosilyticum TaxID=2802395 RepID=A0A964E6G9_9PROT|nr:DNA/RNA non-specific endonuclease [Acidisoma cellulosilyticum]MCB8883023.1 DNA/RNA non-specific endonuclease [Acidisoma cellulosilyticum]